MDKRSIVVFGKFSPEARTSLFTHLGQRFPNYRSLNFIQNFPQGAKDPFKNTKYVFCTLGAYFRHKEYLDRVSLRNQNVCVLAEEEDLSKLTERIDEIPMKIGVQKICKELQALVDPEYQEIHDAIFKNNM